MVDPHEDPDPDLTELDARLRESGLVWPRTDDELDAWLSTQALQPEEEAWLREAVRRRVQEARGPASPGHGPPAIGTPVGEPDLALAAKGDTPARARPLSAEDLALLDRQLLELVEAGVSLPDGLSAYAHELRAGRLGTVVEGLRADLEAGLPLSQAMARRGAALPPLYRALVAAGEAGGDLAGCLLLLHEQAEVDAEAGRRLREALVYPGVALLVSLCGLVLMGTLQLPDMARVFDGLQVELPWPTRAVLGASDILRHQPLAWVGLLVGVPLLLRGGRAALRRLAPSVIGGVLDGRLRERTLAELTRGLSGLLTRGVPLPAAFDALSAAFAERFPPGTLERVHERLLAGGTLGAALRPEASFPRTYVWLIGAAEARGALPGALLDLAQRHERRVLARMRTFEALVGPAVLAAVGVLVGGLVLTVFLPMFELQKQLGVM